MAFRKTLFGFDVPTSALSLASNSSTHRDILPGNPPRLFRHEQQRRISYVFFFPQPLLRPSDGKLRTSQYRDEVLRDNVGQDRARCQGIDRDALRFPQLQKMSAGQRPSFASQVTSAQGGSETQRESHLIRPSISKAVHGCLGGTIYEK